MFRKSLCTAKATCLNDWMENAMGIEMTAILSSKEEFYKQYKHEDSRRAFSGGNLILYAVQNSNVEARYDICNFLLDEGADPCMKTPNNETVLHLLLSRTTHVLERTVDLCSRLLSMGVNPNALDKNNESAIINIINMKFTDEQLLPLYKVWFSYPQNCLNVPNCWGHTPIDLAKSRPYRAILLQRMSEFS